MSTYLKLLAQCNRRLENNFRHFCSTGEHLYTERQHKSLRIQQSLLELAVKTEAIFGEVL